MQKNLFKLDVVKSDIVYTPDNIAKSIIDYIKPRGKCLDPCIGDGAFYRNLPENSEWCELKYGKDFFDYYNKVDWIIGNPPYSIFKDWLEHSFNLSENVVYLLPTNKVFQRQIIMNMINRWGGIRTMIVYGSGQLLGFPFGFSVGTFHFKKEHRGQCEIILSPKLNMNFKI